VHHDAGDVAIALELGSDARMSYVLARGPDRPDETSFVLTKDQAEPGPGGVWPRVSLRLSNGEQAWLASGTPEGDSLVYSLPSEADPSWVTIAWPNIPVFAYPSVRAQMGVGPHEWTRAANGVAPALSWRAPIPLGGDTVTQAIESVLTTFTDPTSNARVDVSVLYRSGMAALPVIKVQDVAAGTDTAEMLGTELETWLAEYMPSRDEAIWAFDVTIRVPSAPDVPDATLALAALEWPLR
jgi:hypothetical protein